MFSSEISENIKPRTNPGHVPQIKNCTGKSRTDGHLSRRHKTAGCSVPRRRYEPVGEDTAIVCDAWPVTADTKLTLTDAHVCVQLAQGCTRRSGCKELNSRHIMNAGPAHSPLGRVYTHTLRFNGHFPGEPGLAGCGPGCPLNSPSPFIPGPCILLGQA